jgi:hypothetical protein
LPTRVSESQLRDPSNLGLYLREPNLIFSSSPVTMASTSSTLAAPSPPALQVNGAPSTSTSSSDANGKRVELRMAMLKKLRPYPLRHEWVFWHERNNPNASDESWADQLKEIAQISTVQVCRCCLMNHN